MGLRDKASKMKEGTEGQEVAEEEAKPVGKAKASDEAPPEEIEPEPLVKKPPKAGKPIGFKRCQAKAGSRSCACTDHCGAGLIKVGSQGRSCA